MSRIARYYDIPANFSARFAPIATKVECRSERAESKLSRDFAARGAATVRHLFWSGIGRFDREWRVSRGPYFSILIGNRDFSSDRWVDIKGALT